MTDDPYRKPAAVDPEPAAHERLLARVRSHRRAQSNLPAPTDAPRYDRDSLRGDATALAAGFTALVLLAAAAVLILFQLVHAA
jgi:hypothetical protein